MSRIARNPEHYTVGIPKIFFYEQTNANDANAVDGVALMRAYCGLSDLDTGHVINADDISTCWSADQIMDRSYVGNIVSSQLGGEITTVEHVASNEGRKEVDKIILSRRSLTYTLGFDELNKQNMQRFFAAQNMTFPTSEVIKGKTTATGTQSAAADFTEAVIEIMDNALTQIGTNCAAIEELLTARLMEQSTDFSPVAIAATNTYVGGVFYFLVGDYQRQPDIDSRLEAYRNKIICGFFKYDPTVGMMKIQAWPTGMNTLTYGYTACTFDSRMRVYVNADSETVAGVPTNDYIFDRADAGNYTDIVHWNFNEASNATHVMNIKIPDLTSRTSVKVKIQGRRWDATGSVWTTVSELLADFTQMADSASDTCVLRTSNTTTPSYFTDPAGTKVKYSTGEITITANPDFITDSDTNALAVQDITITVTAYTMGNSKLLWSGVTWAKHDASFSNMRVNRGKPEVMGPALIVHQNTVGVSYLHVIPRATMRADGTIDFAKDDWEKGSFVLTAVKSDSAFLPNLPRQFKIPFGVTITYKHRSVDL